MTRYTRRRVLASGALGALALGTGIGSMTGTGRTPSYTGYTYAQTDDAVVAPEVSVAWWEAYNGEVLETQAGAGGGAANETLSPAASPAYVADHEGPVVTLDDVVPGDSGALAVGLHVESLPPTEDGVEVWVRLTAAEAENGVVEPEAASGDVPGNGGELGRALDVTVWADGGVGGVGACDGALTQLGDGVRFEPVLAEGSLRDVAGTLADGVPLVEDCLADGDTRCLGLSWRLPSSVENAVQTDGVTFSLSCAAVGCGSGNPFASSAGVGT